MKQLVRRGSLVAGTEYGAFYSIRGYTVVNAGRLCGVGEADVDMGGISKNQNARRKIMLEKI